MGMTQAQLDLIATKIMGWHKEGWAWKDANGEIADMAFVEGAWDPSTSWADCGELVKQLAVLEYQVSIQIDEDEATCRLAKFFPFNLRHYVDGAGREFPEAVARAALALAERMGK